MASIIGVSVSHTEKPLICTNDGIFATITVNGETEKAKIDTGAIHSFISEEFSKELWTSDNYMPVWTNMRFANGTSVRFVEALVVTVCLGDRQCKMRLHILPNATERLVLGLDFLRAINSVLVLADHAITLSLPPEVATNSDTPIKHGKDNDCDETTRHSNVTSIRPDNLDNHEHEHNEETQHRDVTLIPPDNPSSIIKPELLDDDEHHMETEDLISSLVKEETVCDDEFLDDDEHHLETEDLLVPISSSVIEMVCDDERTEEIRQQIPSTGDIDVPSIDSGLTHKKLLDEHEWPAKIRRNIMNLDPKLGKRYRFNVKLGQTVYQIFIESDGQTQVFELADNAKSTEEAPNRIFDIAEIYPKDVGLKNLLKSWGLEHLYSLFVDEKIDVRILKIFKPRDVANITKTMKMGDRVLFEHHFGEWSSSNFPLRTPADNAITADITMPTENSPTLFERILRHNWQSASITDFYNQNKKLNEELRKLLISIIVSYFLKNDMHMSLHQSYQLENNIVETFPNEQVCFYRTDKRGKIYTRYVNQKNIYKPQAKKVKENADLAVNMAEKIVPEDDAEHYVTRLKYDELKVDEFDVAWRRCTRYRINQIVNKCKSISEVLQAWPQYKRPSGQQLIDKDFDFLFKQSVRFLETYKPKIKKLYSFLNEGNIKDVELKTILNSISAKDIETEKESYIFKTLWCLHGHLYPNTKAIRRDKNGGKSTLKYTIKDSQQSVVFVGQHLQQLDNHIDSIKTTEDEPITPLILAVGSNQFERFESFFVYIDGHKMPFDNFLRSFDICFKCFHLFNVDYPKASSHFWNFVEAYFYDITKPASKRSPKACVMLDALQKS